MAKQEHIALVQQGREALNAWRAKNLRGFLDLSNASLAGIDLSGANLQYADFSFADLRGADFTRADLYYTLFLDANLTGAVFSSMFYTGVNFRLARFDDPTNQKARRRHV